jgi:hypothetical protein
MTGACFRSHDDNAESPFTDVEQKLIRLGVDPGATENEADACGMKLIRSLRRRGMRPEQIIRSFVASTWAAKELSAARGRVVDFGRYEGHTVGEVPPGYLRWALKTCENMSFNLRRAMQIMLAAHESRKARR